MEEILRCINCRSGDVGTTSMKNIALVIEIYAERFKAVIKAQRKSASIIYLSIYLSIYLAI